MAYINLYSVPECDMSYEHAPYFGSIQAQQQWFLNKRKVQIDAKISVDPNRTSVVIAESYQTIESWNVDYCSLTDPSGRIIYYFVADYDYTTAGATTLILVLDPLQTYMFDFTFKESFVDRCHVDRWTSDGMPTKELVSEGLDFGENIPTETVEVKKLDKYNVLIAASNPLGITNRKNRNDGWTPTGQGGGPEMEADCWKEGYMSPLGFRFVKGYEAFGRYPYQDSFGYWTIAYGVTKHGEPDIYAKLEKMVPVPEEEGAKITYELKKKNYGEKILPVCKELGITKQCQFDALMSFSFNLGYGVITDRSSKIYKAIKADINNEAAIREAFVAYRNPGTIVEEGLRIRRNEECDIFFNRYPKARPIQIIGTSETIKGDGWLPSGCGGTIPADMKTYEAYGKKLVYPLQGGRSTITSKLGWRIHPITGQQKHHNGDDIGCPLNEPVYAAHDGKVVLSQDDGKVGYGRWIIVQNDKMKIQTYYAHNNKLLVKVGDTVKAGQKIALAGTTGSSTGVHLHYELRNAPYTNKEVVDPLPHLKEGAKL